MSVPTSLFHIPAQSTSRCSDLSVGAGRWAQCAIAGNAYLGRFGFPWPLLFGPYGTLSLSPSDSASVDKQENPGPLKDLLSLSHLGCV